MSSVEVILLEKIERIGSIGDMVSVRRGFARNYLIPQAKALPANAANRARFEQQKDEILKRSADSEAKAEHMFSQLNEKTYYAVRQASNTGALYGAVTARDIAKLIQETHREVTADQISLRDKVKEIGVHSASIRLHAGINATVRIIVARSQEEAANMEAETDAPAADEAPQYSAEYSLDDDSAQEATDGDGDGESHAAAADSAAEETGTEEAGEAEAAGEEEASKPAADEASAPSE